MVVQLAPLRISTKGHLFPVSRQSRKSANDKVDNKMIPGVVPRSPDIYLTAQGKSGKPLLGDRLMKAAQSVIDSNGVPYL